MHRHRACYVSVAVLVLCALAAPFADAQDTAARQVLATWIEKVNDAPEGELDAWAASAFTASFLAQVPVAQVQAVHRQLREAGTFTLESIETATANTLVALLSSSGGAWFRVQLSVAEGTRLIDGLLVEPAAAPSAEPPPPLEWESLDQLAARLAADGDLPGVAIAWARRGATPQVGVAGVRAVGGGDPIEPDDPFHIGSLTKSVTASAIGRLVEAGALRWDARLGELLPDVDMNPAYADAELRTLLRHRARIPAHLTVDDAEMARLNGLPGSPTQQRAAYAAEVLAEEPLDPGFHYSNAGYAIAGAIAERASGRSWEALVVEEVFAPLGLDSCGVGWPATEETPDEPRGHFGARGSRTAQRLDQYELGAFIGPAGNTHCSVADLVRYGQAHLAGLDGEDGFLRAATIVELHAVIDPGAPYAAGWGVDPVSGQHRHNGSVGTFYSYLVIDPSSGMVVAFLANTGPADAQPAAVRAVRAIVERYGQ